MNILLLFSSIFQVIWEPYTRRIRRKRERIAFISHVGEIPYYLLNTTRISISNKNKTPITMSVIYTGVGGWHRNKKSNPMEGASNCRRTWYLMKTFLKKCFYPRISTFNRSMWPHITWNMLENCRYIFKLLMYNCARPTNKQIK